MSSPWDYIAKLVCIGDSGCGKSSLTIRLCEGRFSPTHDVTIGVEFGSRIVPVGPPHVLPPSQSTSLNSTAQGGRESTTTVTSTSPSGTAATINSNNNTTTTVTPSVPEATSGGLPAPRIRKKKEHEAPQKYMKLSLWDTAGQETYKSVTRSYFRGASGALLVFDLTRRSTFQHVTDWLSDLRQIAEPDIVVILVGNKADLAQYREGGGGDGEAQEQENKRQVTTAEAQEWARTNGILEYVETSAKSGENVEMAFMRVAERIYQNIQAGKYDLNDRRSGVKGAGAGGRGQVPLAGAATQSSSGCC